MNDGADRMLAKFFDQLAESANLLHVAFKMLGSDMDFKSSLATSVHAMLPGAVSLPAPTAAGGRVLEPDKSAHR